MGSDFFNKKIWQLWTQNLMPKLYNNKNLNSWSIQNNHIFVRIVFDIFLANSYLNSIVFGFNKGVKLFGQTGLQVWCSYTLTILSVFTPFCPQVSWLRVPTGSTPVPPELLTVGRVSYSQDSCLKSEHSYPNNWRLVLTNLTERDSGLYLFQLATHPSQLLQVRERKATSK